VKHNMKPVDGAGTGKGRGEDVTTESSSGKGQASMGGGSDNEEMERCYPTPRAVYDEGICSHEINMRQRDLLEGSPDTGGTDSKGKANNHSRYSTLGGEWGVKGDCLKGKTEVAEFKDAYQGRSSKKTFRT